VGRLDGKVAVITGAASGMGAASARLFVREGAAVVVADVDVERGETVAAECGDAAVFVRTDVAAAEDVAAAVGRAVSAFGRLDVMFNNAGIGQRFALESLTSDEWDRLHAVLLRGVFFGIKYAVPELKRSGGGSIISTSSNAGVRPMAGLGGYSAMKAGVIALSQSAAATLGPHGIRVNVISPGWTATPLLLGILPPGAHERVLPLAQPIKRAGRPEDVAQAALFLAGDESSFVTGVVLPVDGGELTETHAHPDAMAAIAELAATTIGGGQTA
jgi:NAD(P)-dependent dehydrogenase (short-subunit alcohol dehydrogenase family)